MNYKEKYDKLVEAVKVLQEATPSDEGIQNWVTDNVPELAESEDEKIRRLLISGMKNLSRSAVTFASVPIKDVIDWLEKQGQKFTWSEEDEEMVEGLNNCLDELEKENEWCYIYVNDKNVKLNKVRNWLKSLKDRVQPHPKQEWKEENREELTEFENAMMHIGGSFFGENAGLDPNDTDIIKEQAELLLELAPKTEPWKPSDDQMHSLKQAIDSYTFEPDYLEELYEDLKELKGE